MKTATTLLALALLTAPLAAHAQQDPHAMHKGMKTADAPATDATRAYEAANMKMHKDMTMEFTGNADVDFVRGMHAYALSSGAMKRYVCSTKELSDDGPVT